MQEYFENLATNLNEKEPRFSNKLWTLEVIEDLNEIQSPNGAVGSEDRVFSNTCLVIHHIQLLVAMWRKGNSYAVRIL